MWTCLNKLCMYVCVCIFRHINISLNVVKTWGRLLCKTFFCTRDTTYFLGSNFLCFLPNCSTQHKSSLECLSVSLSVSLGEAMSSDYLLSRSIDNFRDTSVFLLVCSLLLSILEREGLQRHNKCLIFLVLPANQQFAWTDGNVARESQHNTVDISVTPHAFSRFVRENKFFRSCTPSIFFEKQFSFVKS